MIEYRIWRYTYSTPVVPRTLFVVRVGLVVAAFAISSIISDGSGFSPALSSFIPLLAFYAGSVWGVKSGLALLIAFVVIPLLKLPGIFRHPEPPGPEIVGFLVFRLALVVIFFLLAWYLRSEQEQRAENRRLVRELEDSRETIRRYAEQVGLTVALEERTRLAREIHDSIGHALTAITIQLTKAQRYQSIDAEESGRAVAAAQETAREAMDDVRRSIGSLNGADPGIAVSDGIRRFARDLESAEIDVHVDVNGEEHGFNYAVLIGIYRFAQEAITNVLKHSSAKTVWITARFGDDEAEVSVRDDGVGFDPEELPAFHEAHHVGLRGLRNRLELVRGQLEIESRRGGGTTITARVPRNPLTLIGGQKNG
jgi:signal transduction histidine kinase